MKVMHVLNSRIYSGAEKVVCQIIKSFRQGETVDMVYTSPESQIVREMLVRFPALSARQVHRSTPPS